MSTISIHSKWHLTMDEKAVNSTPRDFLIRPQLVRFHFVNSFQMAPYNGWKGGQTVPDMKKCDGRKPTFFFSGNTTWTWNLVVAIMSTLQLCYGSCQIFAFFYGDYPTFKFPWMHSPPKTFKHLEEHLQLQIGTQRKHTLLYECVKRFIVNTLKDHFPISLIPFLNINFI